jgi:hypothetical protein
MNQYDLGRFCAIAGGWGMPISMIGGFGFMIAQGGWGRATIYAGAGFAVSFVALVAGLKIKDPVEKRENGASVFSSYYIYPSEQEAKLGQKLDFLDATMKEVLHKGASITREDVTGSTHNRSVASVAAPA